MPGCCGGRTCADDLRVEREKKRKQLMDCDPEGAKAIKNYMLSPAEYVQPLALKFYARHDWPYFHCKKEDVQHIREVFDKEGLNQEERLDGVVNVPKRPTPLPVTENQIYGWYQHRAYRYLRKDRGVFVFPREMDPAIKVMQTDKKNNPLSR
ncbi:uncharacterized protein LOC115625736 [Scaptodrosophila lebanonensis]|uniref:Uncharacterized protein LOC115625736 n=1 Tax=Drosophila lebanonensis TaxID=7225 RepID=A0A6J2TL37_DROLE|nr:uncharacterized protein LOC115625736 [Scaptodrosophila lebanonensis]